MITCTICQVNYIGRYLPPPSYYQVINYLRYSHLVKKCILRFPTSNKSLNLTQFGIEAVPYPIPQQVKG